MAEKNHEIWNRRFVNRIIDSMADGVFTMDDQGRIASWNRSMERISGYTAAEALGQTCALLNCSHCFGRGCPADIERCGIFEREHAEAKECELQHKDGRAIPVIKNASVVKDDNGRILGVVETVTDLTELNRARRRAEEASLKLGEIHRLGNIIGRSKAMRDIFEAVTLAANSDATILIGGESGTGKELIAGAIHYHSRRKKQSFVAVNCQALPETLLESELFGHAKGAYTGAVHARTGRFEEADGGTIFLDEIGDLSPFIQVKLLRVLQEREIERVGESKRRKIDIRVVCATHKDLAVMVEEGAFREDLYYRLNVFPLRVPPLRERKEDIPLLVSHFLNTLTARTGKEIVDVSREVMAIFMEYHWPGNVRELENAMEHAYVLCSRDRIEESDLPGHLRAGPSAPGSLEREEKQTASTRPGAVSREELLDLLEQCRWNKAEVGRQLGVSHTAVWKYMKKHAIPLQPQKSSQDGR